MTYCFQLGPAFHHLLIVLPDNDSVMRLIYSLGQSLDDPIVSRNAVTGVIRVTLSGSSQHLLVQLSCQQRPSMASTPPLREEIDVDIEGEDGSHHDLSVQRKRNKKAQHPE